MDIGALYDQAGLGPEDIDLFQAYDDYPVICFMQIEDLGFCAKGEAPRRPSTGAYIDYPAASPRSQNSPAMIASPSRATGASRCSLGACCEQPG